MPSLGRLHYLEALPPSSVRPRGALVLLHAFPLNSSMWQGQLELASSGWRVLAPDVRGTNGGESRPAASVDDYAGDVVDLLDGLHIKDAVVAGLSLGGYVALALFRLAPNYIRGLVLADTRAEADTPQSIEGRTRMLALLEEKGPDAIAGDMLPKLLRPATRRDHAEIVQAVRKIILSNSAPSIASMIAALMTRPDSTPLLRKIHVPTLIVVGDEDTATPPAASETMQKAIPGSELVVIPLSGHLSNIEQPERFNAAVKDFLDKRV